MLAITGGLLIGLAGILKIQYVVTTGPASEWPVEMLLSIAAAELLICTCMLAHLRRPVVRIHGALVFASLTIASATIQFSGFRACPCLGVLTLSPRAVFFVDVIFLMAFTGLCLWMPRTDLSHTAAEFRKALFRNGRFLSFGLVLCAVPIGSFLIRGLAPFDDVVIEGSPICIAPCRVLSETRVPVVVLNRSSQPAHIFGGGTSCGCLTMTKLPVTVPANGRAELELILKAPAEAGELNKRFVYYIQHPSQYELSGTVNTDVLDEGAKSKEKREFGSSFRPNI